MPYDQWEPNSITWVVTSHDNEALGREFDLRIRTRVEVKRSGGNDVSDTAFDESFILKRSQKFSVSFKDLKALPFQGDAVTISIEARLKGNGSNGRIKETVVLSEPVFKRRKSKIDTAQLIEPKDVFCFKKNLKALSFHQQIVTVLLAIVALIVCGIAIALGVHDQMAGNGQEIFIPKVNSDGEGQSPLMAALAASGGVGAFFWFLIRKQLRKYMTFVEKPIRGGITPGLVFRAGSLFKGKARIDLHNITLRVVACNQECGTYTTGSGSNRRTHTFRTPFLGLLLYEEKIDLIKKGDEVERWFPGEVYFDTIYEALLPPMMVTGSHGVGVHWEVQLIHDELVDQEIKGNIDGLVIQDFLDRENELAVS
ncbi:MAG: hypothetical protein P1U68_05910 [Verrucomicrobiales bacterium]|nr:hypothetical protein [Verrucomicrobiales bacterium]